MNRPGTNEIGGVLDVDGSGDAGWNRHYDHAGPGGVPQSLRGIPAGFNAQQQPPQQARSVSSRLPNGKLGTNGSSGWAFGSGVSISAGGGGTLPPPARQQMGGNISFAQSVGGSQPVTPLDPSEFPSLSNSSQLASAGGQASLWANAGQRNPAAIQRGSSNTPLSAQGQQEDMFGSSARMTPNQSSFRFGNQASIGQGAPPSRTGSIDDFPPLNRSANNNAGDIGQDRVPGGLANYNQQQQQQQILAASASRSPQDGIISRGVGNGLLNALPNNTRGGAGAAGSPANGARAQEARDESDAAARQKQQDLADSVPSPGGGEAGAPIQQQQQAVGSRNTNGSGSANALGAIVADAASSAPKDNEAASAVQDPLNGMAPIDRWGMKGLRTLLATPEYNAAVSGFGLDLNTLGVDLNSNELLSTQTYSLFDGAAPQPPVTKFRLPDCYKVSNVGPIENKIASFNEETLMWIFYSCPNDYKQHLAAIELSNRNWRWHKRSRVWLTKDDMMMPQVLSATHERGYYIVWDTTTWRKERTAREITLNYGDLDNTPVGAGANV